LIHPLAGPGQVDRQLREAVLAELATAGHVLDPSGAISSSVELVHEARKALKRARALLRLGRGGLPPEVRRSAPRRVGDEGRLLSGVRDGAARVEALDRLLATGAEPRGPLWTLRAWLEHEAVLAAPAKVELAHASERVHALGRELESIRFESDGFELLAPGLRRAVRRLRRAHRRVTSAPPEASGAPAFHRLRKRAKDLRYALEYLTPLWPVVCAALAAETHRLTDLLGEANDLTLVLAALEGQADPDELASVVRQERVELWTRALPLARTLASLTPTRTVELVGGWWDAWSD
jgi:CHAD domain-containing protein